MTTVYLGLGSNLGNRQQILSDARQALAKLPGIRVTAASRLYESEPVGGPAGQGPFLNAVLQLQTEQAAEQLLESCLALEQRFGRERRERWGPRTLDIDLLLYGGQTWRSAQLELPHPRLPLRRFVLAPLAELAPELRVPGTGRSVTQLLAGLADDPAAVRPLPIPW